MQEPRTPPIPRTVLGPVVISLAAGIIVLLGGLFVNGCQISKLLGRSTAGGGSGGDGGGSIVVTPAQVVDSALAGETAPRVTSLAVNGGTWFATPGSPWISVSPARGGPRANVRLSLDPKDLTPGLHLSTVTLQQHDSTGPIATVTVRFRIQQPVLQVKPSSFSFTPRTSNSVFEDTLEVTNDGDGPLVWSATTENQSGWLTLTNNAGTGPGKIAIRATNEGLSYFGTFKETIIVTAPGAKDSPMRIDVTMRRRKHDDGNVP
jgi:BACON domain-containing protein